MSQDMGIPAAVAAFLTERDIPVRIGWSGAERTALCAPEVLVTVREYQTQSGGFAHYLGERYDEQTAAWEECYGRKVALTLGLDLVAPENCCEQELEQLMTKLVRALSVEAPDGLRVENLTCGGICWDEKQRCLRREVTAECTAWLLAVRAEETAFLDFELRGGWKH